MACLLQVLGKFSRIVRRADRDNIIGRHRIHTSSAEKIAYPLAIGFPSNIPTGDVDSRLSTMAAIHRGRHGVVNQTHSSRIKVDQGGAQKTKIRTNASSMLGLR